MTRKIIASAKSKTKNLESMKIDIEVKSSWYTRDEITDIVERIKNKAFDLLREEGFLLQDIKTN